MALGREAELRAHSGKEGGSEVVFGRVAAGPSPPLDLFSVPSPGEGELNGERR